MLPALEEFGLLEETDLWASNCRSTGCEQSAVEAIEGDGSASVRTSEELARRAL